MKTKNIILPLFLFFLSILNVKSESIGIETPHHNNLYPLTNNLTQESINKILFELNKSLKQLPTTTSIDPQKANDEILNKITLESDIYFLNDLSNHLQNPTQKSATKLKNWALTSSKYAEIVQAALKEHP